MLGETCPGAGGDFAAEQGVTWGGLKAEPCCRCATASSHLLPLWSRGRSRGAGGTHCLEQGGEAGWKQEGEAFPAWKPPGQCSCPPCLGSQDPLPVPSRGPCAFQSQFWGQPGSGAAMPQPLLGELIPLRLSALSDCPWCLLHWSSLVLNRAMGTGELCQQGCGARLCHQPKRKQRPQEGETNASEASGMTAPICFLSKTSPCCCRCSAQRIRS